MSANEKLIKELKELREEIHLMRGIVTSVQRYENTVQTAEKRINSILYELTGDEYYNSKKGGK
jgi:uncharacterized protein Yka (UPF0111/DUF47 family)